MPAKNVLGFLVPTIQKRLWEVPCLKLRWLAFRFSLSGFLGVELLVLDFLGWTFGFGFGSLVLSFRSSGALFRLGLGLRTPLHGANHATPSSLRRRKC